MNPAYEPYPVVGAYTRAQAEAFLDNAVIPMRLAARDSRQRPLVTSMWFVRRGDSLLCASAADSKLVARLRNDPHCGFEIARDTAPYHGVRGQAVAQVLPHKGKSVLGLLMDRYLGDKPSELRAFLESRAHLEAAIQLNPTWVRAWDYGQRMADASIRSSPHAQAIAS